jgi:hypothetical protein
MQTNAPEISAKVEELGEVQLGSGDGQAGPCASRLESTSGASAALSRIAIFSIAHPTKADRFDVAQA